jgi:hypothetical protein
MDALHHQQHGGLVRARQARGGTLSAPG